MSTTALLDSASITLDPGGVAAVPLQIHNNGAIVEGYHLEIVGPARGWASIEPEDLSLFPGSTTTATVTFFPPRSASVPAGELKYGVRVIPTENPDETVVPEGAVEVLPFADTTAELVPRATQGRRGARARVAVDNRGNLPVSVALRGADAADLLGIDMQPQVVTVGAGQAAFADVRLQPDRALWRGQPKTLPYTITVDPQSGTPITLDGSYVQQPVLPKWLLKALLLALALMALLAALWFLVLQGAIQSAAQEAVADDVATASEQAQEASAAAEQARGAATTAQGSAADAGTSANEARELVGLPVLPPLETQISQRLQVDTPVGADDSDAFEIPVESTLRLTDLVLSNPQGDFGRVRIEMEDNVLLDVALENFRDLDYHFVTPILGASENELTMTVQCNAAGAPPNVTPGPTECDTAMLFNGVMTQPAPPPSTDPAAAPAPAP